MRITHVTARHVDGALRRVKARRPVKIYCNVTLGLHRSPASLAVLRQSFHPPAPLNALMRRLRLQRQTAFARSFWDDDKNFRKKGLLFRGLCGGCVGFYEPRFSFGK